LPPDPAATLDERLRALAHPVRRQLVVACLREPRPAGELVELTELAPASVSEHLKVLRKTGLLVLEARGRFRLYVTDEKVVRQAAEGVLECLR
jgi:DNA-binding transcriptional ArsR family regulator